MSITVPHTAPWKSRIHTWVGFTHRFMHTWVAFTHLTLSFLAPILYFLYVLGRKGNKKSKEKHHTHCHSFSLSLQNGAASQCISDRPSVAALWRKLHLWCSDVSSCGFIFLIFHSHSNCRYHKIILHPCQFISVPFAHDLHD